MTRGFKLGSVIGILASCGLVALLLTRDGEISPKRTRPLHRPSPSPGDVPMPEAAVGQGKAKQENPAPQGESVEDEPTSGPALRLVPPPKDEQERIKLLQQISGPDERLRLSALERLHAYLMQCPDDPAVIAVIKSTASNDPANGVRKSALRTLVDLPDEESFQVVLRSCVQDHSEDVRIRAILLLKGLNQRIYPGKLKNLKCPVERIPTLVKQRIDDARRTLALVKSGPCSPALSTAAADALRGLR